MVKPKGLGRGLDALLAGDMGSVGDADALRMLKVDQLQPGKYQPRSHMDQTALQTLADSIKSQGIMQPIITRKIAGDRYEIIAGERRWRASQLAGLKEVPVIVRDIPDESALAMALIENIQRENLNPLEESTGIKRLIDEFGMTHETAAHAVGRSRSAVTNLLRLQNLHVQVQEKLINGLLDMGHARALLSLNEAAQITAAEQIIQKGLSVRDAEKLVKTIGSQVLTAPKVKKPDQDVQRLQEEIAESLGADVKIETSAKGAGTLKIRYSSLDQLDEIIAKLKRQA
ncbi:ParB/RepB/Spo0J family partition protein [Methyloradius palustris]|uniref:Chromosome partitioning protein ParB n=1 Tax=Methyloradius palustris TaxID=2778876 RepID=A0A8D5JXN7_9PROT|nr:ParB/RepB/Spo0J family partition protein [Methyloradius palustris]BCM26309.1 chromosome partitioning protein ParB [Methyloradius palustris]